MKVLLFSQRRIATLVAYCLSYEFEDVFAAVTDAQRIDVTGLPALAGAVMIGEAPRTAAFQRQFDWPDAVIHMPFDCPDAAGFLAGLDSETDRVRQLRRSNIRQAALRHDWLYRIQAVFDNLGLTPTEKMLIRAQQLEQIASGA